MTIDDLSVRIVDLNSRNHSLVEAYIRSTKVKNIVVAPEKDLQIVWYEKEVLMEKKKYKKNFLKFSKLNFKGRNLAEEAVGNITKWIIQS
jgi:hypothetical protein